MKRYMIVETRDPFEHRDCEWLAGLAADLKRRGKTSIVVLAENGVFAARAGAAQSPLQELINAGVEIYADRFSLRERGLAAGELRPGVSAAELDLVIDHLESGDAVMFR